MIIVFINNRAQEGGAVKTVLELIGVDSFVLNGKYKDFSQQWFAIVGVTILQTALIEGLSPFAKLGATVYGLAMRLYDRGFSNDGSKTKQVMQEDYEKLYTGPILNFDQTFASLIALIYVIMMFSAAMPMIYIAGIILCFCMYWTDKILLLTFFRAPP